MNNREKKIVKQWKIIMLMQQTLYIPFMTPEIGEGVGRSTFIFVY